MEWISVKKEILGAIMKTDIACEIVCDPSEAAVAESFLRDTFDMFRDFESRYSRFVRDNDLWRLNMAENTTVSPELFDILSQAKRYHAETRGVFDPSVLPLLESFGYAGAYADQVSEVRGRLDEMLLEEKSLTVTKPKGLMIDLGGIGKGYIVDKVARFLGERFENFLVDAGGDMVLRGVNRKEGYKYWAIDVERPEMLDPGVVGRSQMTLLLNDEAVATSGRNRRHWLNKGRSRHHIIDPSTKESASEELLSVTVVATTATEADVFAKTFFILGKERGMSLSESVRMPAIFSDSSGGVECNHFMEPYVWKP